MNDLKALNANLQIVVAFRMLPQVVWQMPELGTFNLHGSLLPQYRGAAPINWAVMNGEKETGVSTFFLQHEIDTGKIIHAAKCAIQEEDTAGSMHDKLMMMGAELVLKTVDDLVNGSIHSTDQNELIKHVTELKTAPKIQKPDCKMNWENTCENSYNKVRGLSPFPTAYAEFSNGEQTISVKIFECKKEVAKHEFSYGTLHTDNKTFLKVAVINGFVHLVKLQLAGKKSMIVQDFLRGFHFSGNWNSI